MRIVVIGSSGLIGSAVVRALPPQHEVIGASRASGVDIEDKASLAAFFERTGPIDALVVAAGTARFGPIDTLSEADFALTFASKVMGQINATRVALPHIRDGGSITLTSGSMGEHPVAGGSAAGMANGALNSFVLNAALEMPRGIRINVVASPWLRETIVHYGLDMAGPPADLVADYYVGSITGTMAGGILRPPTE